MHTAARKPRVGTRQDRKCNDPVILNQWHPVAAVGEIHPATIEKTLLLGEPIAYTRDGDGNPLAWRVDDAPAGDSPVDANRRLPIRADFGYLWTSIGTPPARLFSLPEVDEPGRIVHNAITVGINVSAPRAVENFLDVAHLAFVHPGSLGQQPHTEIRDYQVSTVDGDIWASDIQIFQPMMAAGSTSAAFAEYIYRVPHPHCAVLYKRDETASGRMDIYAGFVHALSEERIRLHLFDCVVEGSATAGEVRRFVQTIVGQDKSILENQNPKRLPLDPRAETPVRADKSSIAYRRYLTEIGLDYGVIRARSDGAPPDPVGGVHLDQPTAG